jgi:hypothetical protein
VDVSGRLDSTGFGGAAVHDGHLVAGAQCLVHYPVADEVCSAENDYPHGPMRPRCSCLDRLVLLTAALRSCRDYALSALPRPGASGDQTLLDEPRTA